METVDNDPIESAMRLEELVAKLANRAPRPRAEVVAEVEESIARTAAYEAAEAERAKANAALRETARRDSVRRAVAALPVPREMVDPIADDNLESDTVALAAVRTWLDERRAGRAKPILVLLSGVGAGKTVAAAWLIARTGGSYAKMRDVANLYRAGFGEDAERFQSLVTARTLVIDELSTERDVDLGRAALNELIDERGAHDRTTLLIANRTRRELAERYDPRTIDRLRHHAKAVDFKTDSMRRGTW